MAPRPNMRADVVQPPDKSIRFIALTKDQIAVVDACDYEWLNQWPWHALKRPRNRGYYAARKEGMNCKPITIYMHRQILGLSGKLQADHRNRNSLDNRRSNLRPATASQNRCNVLKPNKTGFKGVKWHHGKWTASICVGGENIYLGRFADKYDAAKAYNEAALQYEGEFAVLNQL